MSTEERIKEIIKALGADVCGIGAIDRFADAPKGFSPIDLFDGCKSVISFGVALPKSLMRDNTRLIYGHFNGAVACSKVDEIAFYGSKQLEKELECIAMPIPCDAPNDYWEADNLTAKGLISMKHTAVACGLGQLGKNTLLLNPQYGNQMTVGSILTDMELHSDDLSENICIKGCRKCIDECPVSAIGDNHVNQKLCRPNTYGKTARGFDTVECNRCRKICPMKFGKKY